MIYNEDIIIEPIITEKSNTMREDRKYIFRVDRRANKKQIMKAVENLFEVRPTTCNVINVKPKPKRQRYKLGKTSNWKKAIVTLQEGDAISIFDGI